MHAQDVVPRKDSGGMEGRGGKGSGGERMGVRVLGRPEATKTGKGRHVFWGGGGGGVGRQVQQEAAASGWRCILAVSVELSPGSTQAVAEAITAWGLEGLIACPS